LEGSGIVLFFKLFKKMKINQKFAYLFLGVRKKAIFSLLLFCLISGGIYFRSFAESARKLPNVLYCMIGGKVVSFGCHCTNGTSTCLENACPPPPQQ
jgi:hypothetical protein